MPDVLGRLVDRLTVEQAVTPTAEWARTLIREHDAARPRSRQTAIGMSAIGHPCARRNVYLLNGAPKTNPGDPLAAWIGTAVHAQLAEALEAHDAGWLTEVPVEVPGYGLTGNVDAWHPAHGIVLDWKVVGETTLRKVRASGPGQQYRYQIHTYAMALDMRHPVETVAIAFVPRSGRMASVHMWSEPYDQEVAEAALRRLEQLRIVAPLGPAFAPTGGDPLLCSWCPYWLPGSTDPAAGCPGMADTPTPVTPSTVAEALGGTNRK